jgi:hypothetical protein
MEPATYAESRPAVFSRDNFFYGVEASAWLNFEEDELIPAWRNSFAWRSLRLRDAIRAIPDRV